MSSSSKVVEMPHAQLFLGTATPFLLSGTVVQFSLAVTDLGDGAPLFFGKKEEMTEGRKAGWESEIEQSPILSSKAGSATE